MHQNQAEKDQAVTCIRNLCQKNPDFKKIFDDHQTYCHSRCNDLIKIKTRLLSQLKNRQTKPEVLNQLNHQINTLTHELHDRNHRHLLLLKQHLYKEDYAHLINHMINILDKQRVSPGDGKGGPYALKDCDIKPIDNKL